MDLSGNIYIAETLNGDIRQLTCGGDLIPASEFEITGVGGFNFGIIDNLLFTNDRVVPGVVEIFDICSDGAPAGTICFDGMTSSNSWGMYIDPSDQTIYAISSFANRAVYKATVADINSGVCVAEFISQGSNTINIGDNWVPGGPSNPYGITTDDIGNIYILLIMILATEQLGNLQEV